MPPAAQVGHRVDGEQNREIQLGLLFRERQAQVELTAALNHVLQDLIDRILIFAGPGGDFAAHLFAEAVQEGGGAQVRGMGRGIGKQALQVRIVKGRSFNPIVLALALIVLAQGLLQVGQRIDLLPRDHLGRHRRQPLPSAPRHTAAS